MKTLVKKRKLCVIKNYKICQESDLNSSDLEDPDWSELGENKGVVKRGKSYIFFVFIPNSIG